MLLVDAFRYIDETAALSNAVDGFSVYLSGGEPFLRYQDLLAVVYHGKDSGADQVSCVTNGFWGQSADIARRWVTELRDAGIAQICFSLDDFHQDHIPLESVLVALKACREAGVCFAIKSTVTHNTRRLPQILSDLGNLLLDAYVPVQELAYVPQGMAGNTIPKNEWILPDELPDKPCPEIEVLAILPDGTTFPCCGSGWTHQLAVGNALDEPIADLMFKVRNEPLFISLRDKGPAFFIPFFTQIGCPLPQKEYVNRCHLCMTIFSHPESKRILEIALSD